MKILILGFKSAGKTTFGKHLAKFLSLPFFDSDEELMKKFPSSSSIRNVFQLLGETLFREHEKSIIQSFEKIPKGVFALGGGSLDSNPEVNILSTFEERIFLNTDFDVIEKRLRNETGYPYSKTLFSKYTSRTVSYLTFSTLEIYAKEETPEELLNEWKKKTPLLGST